MKIATYVARRLGLFVPQLFLVTVVSFLLIRLTPGDPASALLGPNRSAEGIAQLRKEMGLDQPLLDQYLKYLNNVLHGDLGYSWFSGSSVTTDILTRAPATLELIIYSLIVAVTIGLVLALLSTNRPRSMSGRVSSFLIRMAGSLPDFWCGLVGIFLFYNIMKVAPAPLGRLQVGESTPPKVTGAYTVDCLLNANMPCFSSATAHLALPVLVLGGILSLIVGRVARASLLEVNRGGFITHARSLGLQRRTVLACSVRNALPAVITVSGVLMAYLLGGAVVMEKVFSWGGIGQYAVDAVDNADYAAVQGFLLIAAVFTMFVYLVVDVLHLLVDPRIRS